MGESSRSEAAAALYRLVAYVARLGSAEAGRPHLSMGSTKALADCVVIARELGITGLGRDLGTVMRPPEVAALAGCLDGWSLNGRGTRRGAGRREASATP